jgi:hypothetical protein
MRKLILSLCVFVLVLAFGSAALARNGVYKFPEIKPKYNVYGGYWFVDVRNSESAGEYEYLRNSVSLGGDVIAFPFPHRVHLKLDFLNNNDYFADFSYAYGDKVLSRWINRTLHHNLDNIGMTAFSGYPVARGDSPSDEYGIKSRMDTVFLRLKPLEYPFHVYIDSSFGDKKGSVQQRFQGGDGWWNSQQRVSQERDIQWNTQDITVGANSHLGPVEVDLSHSEKTFTSGGQSVMTHVYTGSPPGLSGTYPHNLIPDVEGSSNTLKIHTSYTGSVVASMTLSNAVRKNLDSGAKADYFLGAAEVRWTPLTKMSLVFKYRHRHADIDNPDSLTDAYYGLAAIQNTVTGIRPSISSSTDTVSGNVRYSVFRPLTVNLGYTHKEIDREDIENNIRDWDVPEKTVENTLSLSARARLPLNLKLKVNYKHRDISDPGSNVQPDRSDGGVISVTWIPVSRLSAFLSYGVTTEERKDLSIINVEKRNACRQKFASSLTYLLKEDLSLTVGYARFNNRIEQDILYGGFPTPEPPARDVQYEDTADNYSVNISYIPKERIILNAGASWTNSSGGFSPDTYDVAYLSELEQTEVVYTASGEYVLKNALSLAMRYKYSDFDSSETSDGTAQTVLMTASKKW